MSVAVDIQGADAVRQYAENKSFTTVVDRENMLSDHFGFKIVPNGIFLNEDGVILLAKQGFRITEPEHVKAVERLINGSQTPIELEDAYHVTNQTQSIEKQLAETKFKLANEYLKTGKKDEALRELDDALLLDPDNFLIRKQRWYIRYPEKFSPTIDIEWQQTQLEKEKAEEAEKLGGLVCGPEGCVIPGTSFVPNQVFSIDKKTK
ncbi:thioredoxin family protein [Fodinisporobacter ferrooxydans]|uniref:Thioredoxin family protein n=1 Tax=Fodinisporobacter ferrooxydans TaxID=2901836 RepID=A0ABY4CG70_9BACL|nr:thioredoxin family protein [Alicyclobacillaceae bacterium MYW30-H2]